MLDAFIIDALKRQREERERLREQPRLELPLYPPERAPKPPEDTPQRGVVIIDVWNPD